MGSLANGLFSALLSWFRGCVGWLWAAVNGEAGGFLLWVGQHWKPILILLCSAGVFLDFFIYLVRWHPWQVWGTFRRKLFHQEDLQEASQQWVYADGSSEPVPEENTEFTEESIRSTVAGEAVSRFNYQDISVSSQESTELPREDTGDDRRVFRNAFQVLLGDEAEESSDYRYQAEKPSVDFSYRDPYIPPQWKKPAELSNREDQP